MNVLVAEDDPNILNGMIEILEGEGYRVLAAKQGKEAVELFRRETPDFVILDIMMPELNGYDVCRELRKTDKKTPIVFLSAKSEEIDKVVGLELGADDYIMKPFGVKELVARVRAISRRCFMERASPAARGVFRLGDLEVHPAELRAKKRDRAIDLSLREVKILEVFRDRPGEVVDRDTLFRRCWGIETYPNSRTLDQHISKLRKKIEDDPKAPDIIKTVHGVGYRFEGAEDGAGP
jgi:two-component system, OmpR family, alkaline phosphatase synthesis response regulator PhoP